MEKEEHPSMLRLESFQITSDPLTPEQSKDTFPPPSKKDENLLSQLHETLKEHPEAIDSENCDYFRQLHALRSKYPDNPKILNYIANGYQRLGLDDKTERLVAETYEKFPEYLFAIAAQANIYLDAGCPEKALKVFKGVYTLKSLYPHRDVFHISEVMAFAFLMIRYFCIKQNIKQAEIHLEMLKKLLVKDHPLLQKAQKMVRRMNALLNLKAALSCFHKPSEKKADPRI
jgi:tetratricopeptide (TPR) repeat protein